MAREFRLPSIADALEIDSGTARKLAGRYLIAQAMQDGAKNAQRAEAPAPIDLPDDDPAGSLILWEVAGGASTTARPRSQKRGCAVRTRVLLPLALVLVAACQSVPANPEKAARPRPKAEIPCTPDPHTLCDRPLPPNSTWRRSEKSPR